MVTTANQTTLSTPEARSVEPGVEVVVVGLSHSDLYALIQYGVTVRRTPGRNLGIHYNVSGVHSLRFEGGNVHVSTIDAAASDYGRRETRVVHACDGVTREYVFVDAREPLLSPRESDTALRFVDCEVRGH